MDPSAERDVHRSIDILLDVMTSNGFLMKVLDEEYEEDEEFVDWCYGAAGELPIYINVFERHSLYRSFE